VRPVTDLGSLARRSDIKTSGPPLRTDARLKKRIVRTVIHEVIADIDPRGGRDRSASSIGRRQSTAARYACPDGGVGSATSTSADVIAAVRQLVLIANITMSCARYP